MRIGFTGTRHGMTINQWKQVERLLYGSFALFESNEWHIGDCVGADSQAHAIVVSKEMQEQFSIETHGHIPTNEKLRAFCDYDITYEPKPYLARNRDIVNSSDLIIAAPQEYDELTTGSGTWATVRYARRKSKKLIIAYPNGAWGVGSGG